MILSSQALDVFEMIQVLSNVNWLFPQTFFIAHTWLLIEIFSLKSMISNATQYENT